MGAGPGPVALADLFRKPGRQRLVGEWLAVATRCAVWRVRVPEVDVQEPVVLPGVARQPVERHRAHLVGALAAAFAGVVDLVEVGVPVPGGVALAEGTDRCRAQAGLAQLPHPARAGKRRAELPAGPLDERVRRHAAVVDDAGVDAEAPGEEGGAAGQAGHVGGVAVVEAHALLGQPVDVRAGRAVVSVAAEMVGAQRVDVDREDAHGGEVLSGCTTNSASPCDGRSPHYNPTV